MTKLNPGDKFNKLTAIKDVGKSKWLWRCDCGNEKILSKYDVTHGRIKSCGCLLKEYAHNLNLKKPGESALTNLYLSYKNSASRRGLSFELTKDKFKELINLPCHYCGSSASNEYKSRYSSGNYKYNGIDRVDCDCGYTPNNVVPSCYVCNRLKGHISYDDFVYWLNKIDINKHPRFVQFRNNFSK